MKRKLGAQPFRCLASSAALVMISALLGPIQSILLTGCGARTELEATHDSCTEEGERRACADACGSGTSLCQDGTWQACEVPRVERACSNACGVGVQVCENGALGACQVAESSRPCENSCGVGLQTCSDGAYSECEVPIVREVCRSVCGTGERVCKDGNWAACTAPMPKPPRMHAVVRDFRARIPEDFEQPAPTRTVDPGIVEGWLGSDDVPVYASRFSTPSTSGRANFDVWFRDVSGVNLRTELDLVFASSSAAGMYVYDDQTFFPIDDQLFGNEGRAHNYHFTLAATLAFRYVGGEVFRFVGDDDLWVFVNRRLAIDLGGTHQSVAGSVVLDERARELDLGLGGVYPLHLFFAERHTVDSTFRVETSLADPGTCE